MKKSLPQIAAEDNCTGTVYGEKELSLLVVEDDQLSREILLLRFSGVFRSVFSAADGEEGFRLFCEHQPDIILSDQLMPKVSGLELMQKIRSTGSKAPLLLMTSTIDNQILLDAINAGVERFVPKPFDVDLLGRTLSRIAGEICNERLLEQHRRQEIERLRHQEAYNSMQQELARRKEQHVVRHDKRDHVLKGAHGGRWGINVAYSPRDIMCGDGYSVRNLFDGRQLIFLVDAMGSGMSASLSAMLATSFFNYQVENLHLWETFTLRIFLKRFQEYLCSMLLAEEVLSCGFLLVDLVREEAECVFFALPPLLLKMADGSVRRVPGKNPPLGIYLSEIETSMLDLSDVTEMLVATDGVTDAQLEKGGSYREVIEGDFQASPTLAFFQRCFRDKIDRNDELDDLTLIHLRRLSIEDGWQWRTVPGLTLSGLNGTIQGFLAALSTEMDLDSIDRKELELLLNELFVGTPECGSVEGNREVGSGSLLTANYEHALQSRITLSDSAISFSAVLSRGSANALLILETGDNDGGCTEMSTKATTEERLVKEHRFRNLGRFSDAIFSGEADDNLIILKTLKGGSTMQIESNGRNELTIIGNIKSIEDSLDIRVALHTLLQTGTTNVLLKITDSFSMTSTVIGHLMKMVNVDKVSISMVVGDFRLYELLRELSLTHLFNVRHVGNE